MAPFKIATGVRCAWLCQRKGVRGASPQETLRGSWQESPGLGTGRLDWREEQIPRREVPLAAQERDRLLASAQLRLDQEVAVLLGHIPGWPWSLDHVTGLGICLQLLVCVCACVCTHALMRVLNNLHGEN